MISCKNPLQNLHRSVAHAVVTHDENLPSRPDLNIGYHPHKRGVQVIVICDPVSCQCLNVTLTKEENKLSYYVTQYPAISKSKSKSVAYQQEQEISFSILLYVSCYCQCCLSARARDILQYPTLCILPSYHFLLILNIITLRVILRVSIVIVTAQLIHHQESFLFT